VDRNEFEFHPSDPSNQPTIWLKVPPNKSHLILCFIKCKGVVYAQPITATVSFWTVLATYHSWFATPFSRNERVPTIVPRYLHLDMSKHVMRNVSRLRLHAHTLKVEAAAWLEDGSCVCDQWNCFPFCLHLFLRILQQPNPFCCNRLTTNLFMNSFFSRTLDFFFFFLSLWIYLCLAETSQQPISQTAWLKVTPHCSHCNHWTVQRWIQLMCFVHTLPSLRYIRPVASSFKLCQFKES